MVTPLQDKSTTGEIRDRFDKDVERFSDLESGQKAAIDAPLMMELIARAAVATSTPVRNVLDVGCGAGNNTLKLLEYSPDFNSDLLDLSLPMLELARQRVSEVTGGRVSIIHDDFRDASLENGKYDVVLAAAVFHHLRDDKDWEQVFNKVYRITAPGGSVWITDLVSHDNEKIQDMMWERYAQYLESVGGVGYRDRVFEYIDKEDSPRSVGFQMDMLKKTGFSKVELLHKSSCFAAFGALK